MKIMTIVRFSHQVESSNLGRDDTDDLLKLISDRRSTGGNTGGFYDNWNDTVGSNTSNKTTLPFKIHSYHLRVWTTGPCIVFSSDVEQYGMVATGGEEDTRFNQVNISNDTVKKWSLTDGGKTWSHLGKDFVYYKKMKSKSGKTYRKRMGNPRFYNNKSFKLQIKNIDPNTTPSDVAYYAIIEGVLEYDAQGPT